MQPLRKLPPRKTITGADYNKLVEAIQANKIVSTANIKRVNTPTGTHLIGNAAITTRSIKTYFVAEVVSDAATQKGLYLCNLQSFDATDWDTTTDGFTDTSVTITGSSDISFNENTPSNDTIVYAGSGDGFKTKGFIPGMKATITGTTSNNKTVTIESLTETTITIPSTEDLTDEANQSATLTGYLEVMNAKETGTTTTNELVAGDRIGCFYFTDDENNLRLIGKSLEGDIRLAITQEAAQADLNISVKLTNRAGTAVGSAFDCLLMETDDATAATSALPRIGSTEKILVWKSPSGTWYVVNPTIIKSSVCA